MNVFTGEVKKQFEILTRLQLQIEKNITELSNSSGPLPIITALNSSINSLLQKHEDILEELSELALEQDDEKMEQLILQRLEKYKKNFKLFRLSLIKANHSAKELMEKVALQERDELFKDNEGNNLRNRKLKGTTNKSLLKGQEELTDSLRQAVQMLTEEVQKSSQTSKILYDSTSMLSKTGDEYKKYGNTLNTSKKVVGSLKRRDLTDKILLSLGLLFFLFTVFYIVRKRIWIPKIITFSSSSSNSSSIKTTTSSITSSLMKKTMKAIPTSTSSITTATTITTTKIATATSSTSSTILSTIADTVETILTTIVNEAMATPFVDEL